MKHFALFWAILTTACTLTLRAQTVSLSESEHSALIDLYQSVRGSSELLVWDLTADPSQWDGITLRDGHVVALEWINRELDGTLPTGVFDKLPLLETIDFRNNKISGKLPVDITHLKELTSLQLDGNKFTGELPDFSGLTKIRILTYGMIALGKEPKVSGKLPDFGKMPDLLYFDCNNANQEGIISDGIGNCTELISFDISNNRVSGTVPSSLAKCTKLADLSLMQNDLSGKLPDLSALSDLGNTDYPNAWGRFFVSENRLEGEFPQWITKLHKLKRIALQQNKFTGSLPKDWSDLTELIALYAFKNQLTGTLPEQLPQTLEEIDLSYNKLEGSLPASWQTASNLNKVHIAFNRLSGSVPDIASKLKNLEILDVTMNNFSFADFEAWQSYAKADDTRFRFGVQRNFAPTERIDRTSGASAELICTLPAPQPGNITFQWMNLATGKEVPGGNESTLHLQHLTAADAARYVCLISTDFFGKDPAGDEENAILPMMASGFFDLYVDGNINHTEAPHNRPIRVYPTRVTDGLVHFTPADAVCAVALYSVNGERVLATKVVDGELTLGKLPAGNYLMLLTTADGARYTQMLCIE